jgi:hypothetical protein
VEYGNPNFGEAETAYVVSICTALRFKQLGGLDGTKADNFAKFARLENLLLMPMEPDAA